MSQMKLENVSGLVPVETVLPAHRWGIEDVLADGRGTVRAAAAEAESFGDHLWRVQSQSEDAAAGGQPDSARLSPPQAAPPDLPQQSTAKREPADDDRNGDRNGDPRDPADVDSDENVAGRILPERTAENDRAGAAEAETGADDRPAAEAVEAASPTQQEQEQEADTNPGTQRAKVVPPHEAPGKPSAKQPQAQIGGGRAGRAGSDSNPAEQDAGSAAQTLSKQAGPASPCVSEENAAAAANSAAANTEALEIALTQETDGTDGTGGKTTNRTLERIGPGAGETAAPGYNRSGKRGAEADQAPAQQKRPQTQASLAGTPRHTQRHAEGQAGLQVQEQPAADRRIAVAAADAGADAPAVSSEPATSTAEQKGRAAEETARPASTPTADGRFNASLRISPGQQPGAGPVQQPQKPGESAQVDRARFVQRVARAFAALGKNNHSVRLRLSPPQLGSLRLEITVRNGQMTARVEAETPTARKLLLDNLPALRDRLAQQDIRIKQFDVNLMNQSPGGLPDQRANHTQSHHRGGNAAPRASSDGDREANTLSGPPTVNRPGEGTQLNVVI